MKRPMRSKSEVELNLASMLDMAFQLLAFFVMTFQLPPEEAQVRMHMPAPQPAIGERDGLQPGKESPEIPPGATKTLVITVGADNRGNRTMMAVGSPGKSLSFRELGEMGRCVGEFVRKTRYEQVLVQVDPRLQYGQLMEVMSECAKQKTSDDPNAPNLTRLSFVSTQKTKNL
jgi:biopolymer transport protein ExbD